MASPKQSSKERPNLLRSPSFRLGPLLRFAGVCLFGKADKGLECDVLGVFSDSQRDVKFKGEAYSTLVDVILDDLHESTGASVATTGKFVKTRRRMSRYGRYFSKERFANRAMVKKYIGAFLAGELHQVLGVRHSARFFSKSEYRLWKSVFEECGCVACLVVSPSREMCRAGSDLGVKIVNVSHGSVYEGNSCFDEPSFDGLEKSDKPWGVVCWDEREKRIIERSRVGKVAEVFAIGKRFFVGASQGKFHSADFAPETFAAPKFEEFERVFLVTVSWGYFAWDYGIPDFLFSSLQSAGRSLFLFKLHPYHVGGYAQEEADYFRQRVREAGGDNVEIEWTSRMPTALLLTKCIGHITLESSCVAEAAYLGIPSVAVGDREYVENFFRDFLEAGSLTYLGDGDSLDAWIESPPPRFAGNDCDYNEEEMNRFAGAIGLTGK